MPNTREKLIEFLTAYFGVDPMYYGVDVQHLVDHLIANGATVQDEIDAKTFRLMRECERLKEEKESFANAVNVLEEINSDLYKQIKGVTVQKWIPVEDKLPQNFVSVLGYMTDAGEFAPVRECYTVGNAFFFPALGDVHPVSHWCEMPQPPKGE